jgi:hypothetical protein
MYASIYADEARIIKRYSLLGQAFLDLIDEAFTQHRQWRETQEWAAYRTWAESNKSQGHRKVCSSD